VVVLAVGPRGAAVWVAMLGGARTRVGGGKPGPENTVGPKKNTAGLILEPEGSRPPTRRKGGGGGLGAFRDFAFVSCFGYAGAGVVPRETI